MRIILTGSSSGIGRALALRLLHRGHTIWGLARTDQLAFVNQFPGKCFSTQCDVSVWAEVEAAQVAIARKFSYIDALIACAGAQGAIGRATTLDPHAWSATVRANLDGAYFPIRAFWPALVAAKRRAKIVCFSGGGSTKARPNFSAYSAAKTAIVRLVETIATEEKAAPLDINAIAPGAINTAMTEELLRLGPEVVGKAEYESAKAQRASVSTSDGSLDLALDLVEWLLSPQSDGVSGRLISAPWDAWPRLQARKAQLDASDIYMLRRIVPSDRGETWT